MLNAPEGSMITEDGSLVAADGTVLAPPGSIMTEEEQQQEQQIQTPSGKGVGRVITETDSSVINV